jgi:glycerophosphoryl diester phosphodiesterase
VRRTCWHVSAAWMIWTTSGLLAAEPATSAPDRPVALMRLCDPRWDGRMVSAHRGDREAGPDNSAAAIAATANDADTIEVDVQPSRDGVYFCFHDPVFKASNSVVPDASWNGKRLGSLTAAQIRQVRTPGPKGEPILTFEQALAVAKQHRACLQLDMKTESNPTADAVIGLARAAGMDRWIIVQCQLPTTVAHVRKEHPQVAVLARCRSEAMVRLGLNAKATIIQVDDEWATDEMRRRVRSAGAKLLVKVLGGKLDQPKVWQDRYAKGYHLLLTDKPRELRAWLEANRK